LAVESEIAVQPSQKMALGKYIGYADKTVDKAGPASNGGKSSAEGLG
jgi:hypothetical protein